MKKSLCALCTAAAVSIATATPALATITFTISDQGSGQGQEVLLNDSNAQGFTVLAHTNGTGDGITFTSTQTIGDAPNGQALIGAFTGVGGTAITLNNLAFAPTDPLLAFQRVEFDLTNTGNLGDAVSVTLYGTDQFNNEINTTFTTHLTGQDDPTGTNWLVGTASNGEVITGVRFTTPTGTGFTDFRQLRVDLVPRPTPEPGTWAMMLVGFGAVGFRLRYAARGKYLLKQTA